MTDEELAALRARLRGVEARSAATIARYAAIKAREDEALLAEVAAWREIGRAVVAAETVRPYYGDYGPDICVFACVASQVEPWDGVHSADCPVAQVRALLGDGNGEA